MVRTHGAGSRRPGPVEEVTLMEAAEENGAPPDARAGETAGAGAGAAAGTAAADGARSGADGAGR